ncbi:MAG: transposase [Ardenticatenaceae bacterium]|nr:transposase [Anaerolineales bacterium]MCB8938895.1 transposase [Ardenticatenaceae bacterium]MCB8974130.1 transposase [Ardenticatenaceae bacterium]
MIDFAHCMRDLVDVHFPEAAVIVLVMDNLNTHKLVSLYEAFPPEEARRIISKLEIHYTPKHGSWLNMAEIELSVLQRQWLRPEFLISLP